MEITLLKPQDLPVTIPLNQCGISLRLQPHWRGPAPLGCPCGPAYQRHFLCLVNGPLAELVTSGLFCSSPSSPISSEANKILSAASKRVPSDRQNHDRQGQEWGFLAVWEGISSQSWDQFSENLFQSASPSRPLSFHLFAFNVTKDGLESPSAPASTSGLWGRDGGATRRGLRSAGEKTWALVHLSQSLSPLSYIPVYHCLW